MGIIKPSNVRADKSPLVMTPVSKVQVLAPSRPFLELATGSRMGSHATSGNTRY